MPRVKGKRVSFDCAEGACAECTYKSCGHDCHLKADQTARESRKD